MCRRVVATALFLLVMLCASSCGTTVAPSVRRPSSTPTGSSASPAPPTSAPADAYGSFTFTGWLNASGVGPVDPRPFATVVGAVPGVPPTSEGTGLLITGSAAGTQCFHASSRSDIDQYEALLVFLVRGQRYLLSLAFGFQRPAQSFGDATPPAGGRLTDAGGNGDQVHLDPEAVRLGDDPMFVGSYSHGTVRLARDLRSGSLDITLTGLAGPSGAPVVHVSGSFVCP